MNMSARYIGFQPGYGSRYYRYYYYYSYQNDGGLREFSSMR